MTVAFYLPGNVPIYAFPLILGGGAFLGLLWVAWRTQEHSLSRVDAGVFALVGALIGGRLGFVAVNWNYFQTHLFEALQVSRGGLTWPGAAVGALIGLGLMAWLTPASLLELLDDTLPLAATLTISAWLGCWLDGCGYGPLAPNDWWGIPSKDAWGNVNSRWPTQLFGAVLALALFWGLDLGRHRLTRPGSRASVGYVSLFFVLFALSFLRDDPAFFWQGLRLETWAALVLVGIAVVGLYWAARRASGVQPNAQPADLSEPISPSDPPEHADQP